MLLLADVMSMHFFFCVTNVGSWLDIGNSLSRFGILNSQVDCLLEIHHRNAL
jgi:phosphatidylinositol glycan class N